MKQVSICWIKKFIKFFIFYNDYLKRKFTKLWKKTLNILKSYFNMLKARFCITYIHIGRVTKLLVESMTQYNNLKARFCDICPFHLNIVQSMPLVTTYIFYLTHPLYHFHFIFVPISIQHHHISYYFFVHQTIKRYKPSTPYKLHNITQF